MSPRPEPRRRIDVAEAAALIADNMPSWPAERVPLDEAAGAILRETLSAERDQPPFDRVTMDGIAVRHATLAAGARRLRILGTQGAGMRPLALEEGETCIEIMTGASLPEGADTVIPVERLEVKDGHALLPDSLEPKPGQYLHRRASDHRAGDVLLEAGTRIGPPEMAILTIGGKAEVAIGRWPRIALVSTGSELVEPGQPMADWQIRASNERALGTALRTRGFVRQTRMLLPDDPALMEQRIRALLDTHEVLILSGGVSMGRFDHVPAVLEKLGLRLVFHKVLQRPGLPFWFGVTPEGQPVFALPGNPVSSLVCLVRYVLPALSGALGSAPAASPRVRLAAAVQFAPDLCWLLPVRLVSCADGALEAVARPPNTSGDFVSLHGSDGFVELPRGQDDYPAGFVAAFHAW
ncbi:MAG: molybdopterin molybdotransferase MoeA [Chromatiales bacterium]|nr:molybdopterin molybdotransferase MoeA [Chromatiales bacterium]